MEMREYNARKDWLGLELKWDKDIRKSLIPTVRIYTILSAASWAVTGGYGLEALNTVSQEGVSARVMITGALTVAVGAGSYILQKYAGTLQRRLGGIEEKIKRFDDEMTRLDKEFEIGVPPYFLDR